MSTMPPHPPNTISTHTNTHTQHTQRHTHSSSQLWFLYWAEDLCIFWDENIWEFENESGFPGIFRTQTLKSWGKDFSREESEILAYILFIPAPLYQRERKSSSTGPFKKVISHWVNCLFQEAKRACQRSLPLSRASGTLGEEPGSAQGATGAGLGSGPSSSLEVVLEHTMCFQGGPSTVGRRNPVVRLKDLKPTTDWRLVRLSGWDVLS